MFFETSNAIKTAPFPHIKESSYPEALLRYVVGLVIKLFRHARRLDTIKLSVFFTINICTISDCSYGLFSDLSWIGIYKVEYGIKV